VSYRKKHLLEGVVRTCTMMHGMEDYRMHCNEVSLPFLEKDGGRGYLRLLKHFMVKDPTSVSKVPIYLPSPQWDQFAMGKEENSLSEKELAFKAYYDGVRNTFICEYLYQSIQLVLMHRYITGHFLFNTLSSFHGHSMVPAHIAKAPTPSRLGTAFQNEMVKRLGPLGSSITQHIKQEVLAARGDEKISCESCLKSGESSDFKVCGVCKRKFDRRIYYCSALATLKLIPKNLF
jgi:hypothetical protein